MRNLIVVCLLAVLTAMWPCAVQGGGVPIAVVVSVPEGPPEPVVGSLTNIHSVAVISAIGSQFVIENHYFLYYHVWPVPIADWKIDEQVDATLRQGLGDRFSFKSVAYDRDALAAIPNGRWDSSENALQHYLSNLPNPGVDAFIVVRPSVGGTVTGNAGLGLWADYRAKTTPTVSANYELDIMDAHSFATISKAFARLDDIPGAFPRVAHIAYGKDLEVEDESVPPPPVYAKLRQASVSLVERSLADILRALQLESRASAREAKSLRPIPPEKDIYAPAKSIAVISVLGDDVALLRQREGIFPGNAASMRASVPSWKLDEKIEARIKADVAKRFAVKDVAYDRRQLAWSTVVGPNKKFVPRFPGLSPSTDVDLYAVVFKTDAPVWGQTDGYGLGLVNDDQQTLRIFANYGVAIIDAHSLKPLGILYGASDTMTADAVVAKNVPLSLWPATPPNFTAKQTEETQETLMTFLDGSLDATLILGGLTGEMLPDMPPALTLGPRPR